MTGQEAISAHQLARRVLDRWSPHELHGYKDMGPDGQEAMDALDELVIRANRVAALVAERDELAEDVQLLFNRAELAEGALAVAQAELHRLREAFDALGAVWRAHWRVSA